MTAQDPENKERDAQLESSAEEDGLAIGQMVGRYRVVRLIGRGGMGTVFEAVHQEIGYRAAIKVLRPEYSRHAEVARRFLNEARAVNLVQHPGLVKIFEFGHLRDGTAYIIMEFLEGHTLIKRMEVAGGRLSPPEALRLVRQIASTVAEAHRRGIIHRDLKPANVMLVPDPEAQGKERAKLLDFGLAKVAESIDRKTHDSGAQTNLHTRSGLVLGTAMYMAPEQCRGSKEIDGRADVYSLGIMLYEMLCGQPPFVSESEGELVSMHLRDAPPSLSLREPAVPPELDQLVHAMLVKSPAERPTMDEVIRRMEQLSLVPFLNTSGPLVLSPSRLEDAVNRTARRRMKQLALVAAALAVFGAAGHAVWRYIMEPMRTDVDPLAGSFARVPAPVERHLRAVWKSDRERAWVVGDNGVILEGQGLRFTLIPSDTTQSLRAVWGSGPNDVWVAGKQGTLLHWTGGPAWTQVQIATQAGLLGLSGSGPDDVWAVGEQGVILHYDGKEWIKVPSGVTDDFRSVWAHGPKEAWAVGEYGTVLRYDGTKWVRMQPGTSVRLARVWGEGPEAVWVVGNEGTILFYDGKVWRRMKSGTSVELSGVWGPGRGDVWVIGNAGTVLHFDGTRFRRVISVEKKKWLYGIFGTGPDDIWAVGTSGTILRHHW